MSLRDGSFQRKRKRYDLHDLLFLFFSTFFSLVSRLFASLFSIRTSIRAVRCFLSVNCALSIASKQTDHSGTVSAFKVHVRRKLNFDIQELENRISLAFPENFQRIGKSGGTGREFVDSCENCSGSRRLGRARRKERISENEEVIATLVSCRIRTNKVRQPCVRSVNERLAVSSKNVRLEVNVFFNDRNYSEGCS